MEDDFFSALNKNVTGFDLVFGLTGVLWLIGTVTAFYEMGLAAFAVLIPLWLSFFSLFYLIKKWKIKSTWWKALLLFIVLHTWKVCLVVGISMTF